MGNIPAGLVSHRQFIIWRLEPGAVKPTKVPVNPRAPAYPASVMDPGNWLSADEAVRLSMQLGPAYGVGFVFTEELGLWFLDIDGALTPEREWNAVAQQLVQVFDGAYVEVSQSGQGIHIVGTGPVPEHGCKNKTFHLELYHTDRFMALGLQGRGDVTWRSDERVQWLVQSYFAKGAPGVEQDDVTSTPVPEWIGPVDDAELVRRAMNARSTRSMFSDKVATFADLWTANAQVLAHAYPSGSGDAWDRSMADQALMQHLAFWTGKDGERMLRLMRQSALVREKWDKHRGYLRMTCITALSLQREVCRDKLPEPGPMADIAPPAAGELPMQREVTGSTYMSASQQRDLFRGCVYVSDQNGILVAGGDVLDASRFKVMYGGYTFAMDNENARTSRNAWEAFTESQSLRPPRADTTTFRPDLPHATIVVEGGRKMVNTWWPIEIERVAGNADPFLRHLAKLLPDQRDAAVLLYYMAACVQHKGIKFQWAPLLQGVEGNGKTFFSFCVMNAVGMRYCHIPRAMDINSKFNPWVRNKLIVAIEDVYAENDKTEILEVLKPMITGRMQPVEAKGVDQVLAQICANFIFNSNHKDGVRKTPNDRRIAPLFTAQQSTSHLQRDGLSRDYFTSLYEWYQHGGMPVVNHLLATIQIPEEFNPALGGIAPVTTSTDAAIAASMGTVEQNVLEVIEQGLQGFMGGWVSSMALDKYLESKNLSRRVAPNKRRELMQSLGYDYHPALPDGRVNNLIMPDAGKPRLFVKAGHPCLSLTSAAEVARAYSAAQMPGTMATQG
jgi:hypothetical protein